MLCVFDKKGIEPDFTYSIGIQQTSQQPELIVTGLNRELAHWIINEYNDRVRAGEQFEPNRRYSGFLEGFDVMFETMSTRHYDEYLGWAQWLYEGNDFKTYQLIWPSTGGLWPSDPERPADYDWALPRLYDE